MISRKMYESITKRKRKRTRRKSLLLRKGLSDLKGQSGTWKRRYMDFFYKTEPQEVASNIRYESDVDDYDKNAAAEMNTESNHLGEKKVLKLDMTEVTFTTITSRNKHVLTPKHMKQPILY